MALKNIGRNAIGQKTDDLQLSILIATGSEFDQRRLFLLFLSHFMSGRFLYCVAILVI